MDTYLLGDFISDMKDNLRQFEKYWKLNHELNPEHFPLEFGEDNTGAWDEQFNTFLETRNG